ncbi:hypothetical protein ABIE06_004306 [Pantoea dispersa]
MVLGTSRLISKSHNLARLLAKAFPFVFKLRR